MKKKTVYIKPEVTVELLQVQPMLNASEPVGIEMIRTTGGEDIEASEEYETL